MNGVVINVLSCRYAASCLCRRCRVYSTVAVSPVARRRSRLGCGGEIVCTDVVGGVTGWIGQVRDPRLELQAWRVFALVLSVCVSVCRCSLGVAQTSITPKIILTDLHIPSHPLYIATTNIPSCAPAEAPSPHLQSHTLTQQQQPWTQSRRCVKTIIPCLAAPHPRHPLP